MSLAFRSLRVYLRIIVLVAAAVAVGLVLLKNRGHAVPFWFFGLTDASRPINVIYLMLCTAAGTLAGWWALSLGRGLWREVSEMKRRRAIETAAKVLSRRTAELEERQRQVGEKLQDTATTKEQVEDR